jgi:hypothetical protein
MKSLIESVKEFVGSLKVGDKLKYITGQNTLEVVSVGNGGDWIKFKREAAAAATSEHTVKLSTLEEVATELESGKAVHFETFFHGGGNLRTAYETLLAHSPRISWCQINNQKHLKAFDHEVHDPGELWRSDEDTWSNPEWALSTLVFLNHVKKLERSTIGADLERLLVSTTNRNGSSWQRRISNFKAAEEGGVYIGGESTKKRAIRWLERKKNSLSEVAALARWSFKSDARPSDVIDIGKMLGIRLEIVKTNIISNKVGDEFLARCLYAKSFLILTGNSGTGKTRMAETLAETFCCSDRSNSTLALVAVGADWTDNRSVIGFVNHLRSAKLNGATESHPVYQSTGVLDLMLAANQRKEWPHFLILDEMNLSHVERYFADFLSAMEARNGVIRLHDEGPRDDAGFRLPRFDSDPLGVPRELPYPPNLFVIGTVNIDETTYMFSPKVLDRAHVIEFKVDSDAIRGFLGEPKELKISTPAGEAAAKAFLQLSLDARSGKLDPLKDPEKTEITNHLINLLEILQRGRFEFAYRTANEVTRYLRVCRHLAEDKAAWSEEGWKTSLDDEILQKILPRLHGSRNRLGPLLGALACYLHAGDRKAADEYFPAEGDELAAKSIGDPEFRAMAKAAAMFPRSFAKIKMMSEVLVEEQFVSFIC